ncbi:MAG: hypothetical protein II826_00435 [Prevotella sp.]|nr:hypothetical protein [Prevotella sp.]
MATIAAANVREFSDTTKIFWNNLQNEQYFAPAVSKKSQNRLPIKKLLCNFGRKSNLFLYKGSLRD